MKKIAVNVSLFMAVALSSCAQRIKESDVPEPAKKAFSSRFTDAKKVKWEKEGENWEVNFDSNTDEMSAVFQSDGDFVEQEKEIEVADLPAAARKYVETSYKNEKIKEAALITKADGQSQYEAEIGTGDLLFDQDGNFIKLVRSDSDNDND